MARIELSWSTLPASPTAATTPRHHAAPPRHHTTTATTITTSTSTLTHPRTHAHSQAQGQVMEAWANGAVEGLVSWVEFLNYYKALSACVADDREFLEGVQSTWSLPSHTETGVFRAGTSRLLDA